MKTGIKKRKILSVLLVVLVALVLSAAIPQKVHAADAATLADRIAKHDHGGNGSLNVTQSGKTLTVTGEVNGVKNGLWLNLDEGVRIVWKARFSGSAANKGMINLEYSGGGIFEVAEGGYILANDGVTITNPFYSNCYVIVAGGTVENAGTDGYAIEMRAAEVSVLVHKGGKVLATGTNGKAIKVDTSTTLDISGGQVIASGSGEKAHAIYLNETAGKSIIYVKAGTVSSKQDTIKVNSPNSLIVITGGLVESKGTKDSRAINMSGKSAKLEVRGGKVTSAGEDPGTVSISGQFSAVTVRLDGKIENTGSGAAIYQADGSKVTVGDKAVVSALSGKAIVAKAIELTGGFVFAHGPDLGIIKTHDGSSPSISGTAVVCAWKKPGGVPGYEINMTNDLTVNQGATARWGVENNQVGIAYQKDQNTGFFPVNGVGILAPPPQPPETEPPTDTSTTTTTTTTSTSVPTTTPTSTELSETDTSPSSSTGSSLTKKLESESLTASSLTVRTVPDTEAEQDSDSLDNDKVGGFNRVWLLVIACALLLIAGGLVLFIFLRKRSRK